MTSDVLLDHSNLPTEAALVLCCATTSSTAERTAKVAELAKRVRNWDHVVDLAKSHAVLPLVHRYLDLECRKAAIDGLTGLRAQWRLVALYNHHLASELVRLMGLLEAAGIAAVTFKGPALAAMAYGSIELRQFVDLDILVRQADLPKVAEILTAQRYLSPHSRREGLMTGYFQEFEDAFFAAGGLGAVDVHWNITSRAFRFAPDDETFWQHARAVELPFGTVNTIAPEDLILYMCVHSAKHGWVMLGSICDIGETIRARPGIDLMAILAEATALGSRKMFLTGIYLAHDLVGAPVAEELITIARDDRAVSALASRVAHGLFGRSTQGRADFDPWAVPVLSIESPRDQMRYIVHRLLAPTMGDYELIPLPTTLFPLYWAIRPFRMAIQYGHRLIRPSSR